MFELLFAKLLKACAWDSKGYRRGYPLAGYRVYEYELTLKWGSAHTAAMDNDLSMLQNPMDSSLALYFFISASGLTQPRTPRPKCRSGSAPLSSLQIFYFAESPPEGFNAKPLWTPAHKLFQKSLIKNLQLRHFRTGHLTPHAPDGAPHTL